MTTVLEEWWHRQIIIVLFVGCSYIPMKDIEFWLFNVIELIVLFTRIG